MPEVLLGCIALFLLTAAYLWYEYWEADRRIWKIERPKWDLTDRRKGQ